MSNFSYLGSARTLVLVNVTPLIHSTNETGDNLGRNGLSIAPDGCYVNRLLRHMAVLIAMLAMVATAFAKVTPTAKL